MSIRIVERLLVVAGLSAILFGVGACMPEQVAVIEDGAAVASGAGAPHSDAEGRTDNAGFFNVLAGVSKAAGEAAAQLCSAANAACVALTNASPPQKVTCGSISEIPADDPDQDQTMLFCNGEEPFIHECTGRTCDSPHPVPGPPVATAVCDSGDCGFAAFTSPGGGGLQAYNLAQNRFLNTVPTPGCDPSALDLEGDWLYVSCEEADEVRVFPIDPDTGQIGAQVSTVATCSAPSSIDVAPNGQIGATTCTEGIGVIDLVAGETPIVLPCTKCFDVVITDDATCAYGLGDNLNGFNLDNFVPFATLPPPPGAAYTAIGRSPGETQFYVAFSTGEVGVVDRNLDIRGVAQGPNITTNVILSVANDPN
jgi:hypothetical protein